MNSLGGNLTRRTLLLGAVLPLLAAAPFPPHKIADDLYYVGTADLSSYLVKTDAGLILINPSFEKSVPEIRANIEKLGFRFSDVKILLISHAHDDHAAGSALVKRLTGARFMVMDRDVPEITAGGVGDFHYPAMRWPPVKVDRVLHDGDTVKLGAAVLTAHLTPGHTKGCTTWTLPVTLQGRRLKAVIVGSPNVNAGYRLVGNKQYPEIASDFAHTFQVLKGLPCDIFLGAHGAYYEMAAKVKKLDAGDANAFVDPEGYTRYVANRERAFRDELERQKTGS
ncbi:MAG: subclass B3 metallo-beta-lactamase [Acidobacteriota bacterium]|nr:subclass B3 metallo-beta-lactamase [Acidobacteriota bacterium]